MAELKNRPTPNAEQGGRNGKLQLDMSSYRRTVDLWQSRIQPGAEVPDGTPVGFIRSANIHHDTFSIRNGLDTNIVGGVLRPGSSATIIFDREPSVFVPIVLHRPPGASDRLYEATPEDLARIGFTTLFAPVSKRRLHLQVVHEAHMEDPTVPDVPVASKKDLAKSLMKGPSVSRPEVRTRPGLTYNLGDVLRGLALG